MTAPALELADVYSLIDIPGRHQIGIHIDDGGRIGERATGRSQRVYPDDRVDGAAITDDLQIPDVAEYDPEFLFDGVFQGDVFAVDAQPDPQARTGMSGDG